jgi:hypothetical protein
MHLRGPDYFLLGEKGRGGRPFIGIFLDFFVPIKFSLGSQYVPQVPNVFPNIVFLLFNTTSLYSISFAISYIEFTIYLPILAVQN